MRLKLIVFVIIVLAAVFLWFMLSNPAGKPGKSVVQNMPSSGVTNPADQNDEGTLGVKDFVNKQISNSSNGINSFVEDQKRNIANALLGQSQQQPVSISAVNDSNNSMGDQQPNFTIDVRNDQNLNLNFSKESRYYLKFTNVPASFCLYVGDTQYPIDDTKMLLLQFGSRGNFTVRTNLCDLNFKNLGQFVVN